jgi:phosphoglycerol transferase MdoB-like AlkP superfamily enzyme
MLLESFSQPVITELDGDGEAAPNINGLVPEGIFFNRIYSTGTMTDRAIGAVFGGYPGVPGTCIIYYEAKAQKLPNLNRILKSNGYNSAFLYGGDIDFAHIRSFLVMGGFEDIISDINFPRSIPRSSWGVADHYLFDKLAEMTNQASEPFFHVLMTLSSHTPYDIPMEPVFAGSGDLVKYRNSVYYTDSCLGEFMNRAAVQDWWDNTLVILMADHGFRVGDQMAYEPEYFRIPMLWLGGALAVRDTIISKYGSQTDLAVTLLNQMGLPAEDFIFGKDLLSEDSESFAFFTYPEGIGFINDSSRTAYSLITGDFLFTEGPGDETIRNTALAYLQYLLSDFNGL